MYSYESQEADDLQFKQGDYITVTSRADSDWWSGRVNGEGREGIFPSNYVDNINDRNDEPQVNFDLFQLTLTSMHERACMCVRLIH